MPEYIYLPDSASDNMYCSRCGAELFAEFGKREEHRKWINEVLDHMVCAPPEENKDDKP